MTEKPNRVEWNTIFDASPMADGMPPDFLLKQLFTRPLFVRHGKLLTAILWLQSQMVGLILLETDPELRKRCRVENGRHLPVELRRASLEQLDSLTPESMRDNFLKIFGQTMSEELKKDLDVIMLYQEGLCNGHLSLFQQITGQFAETMFWSPRPTIVRNEILKKVTGQNHSSGSYFLVELSELKFDEHIERICRLMNFIASQLKRWDIPFPVLA